MFGENSKMFEKKEPYENIYGSSLNLSITKNSNITEITISKSDKNYFGYECLSVFSTLFICLILVLCGLLNVKYFILVIIGLVVISQRIFRRVKYEKLLYVSKLGCQITVKYTWGFSTTFIPSKSIQGIFINEVFSKHRVLFVLSILIKDDTKEVIIPLFTGTKPRLKCLEIIYQNLLD